MFSVWAEERDLVGDELVGVGESFFGICPFGVLSDWIRIMDT